MRVPTLIDTFNLVCSTLCSLMTEVIFVRCSVDSLAEPEAAPWPVVFEPFCSDLERTSALPGALDLSLSIAPALSGASDFGDCPVVSGALPVALLSGVAWPVVCGDFWSPAFIDGATFSAGAVCYAAGARSGRSLPIPCAETAPALSSNAMAAVDNSFVFLTGCLLWMPLETPTKSGPGWRNVLFDLPVPKLTDLQ